MFHALNLRFIDIFNLKQHNRDNTPPSPESAAMAITHMTQEMMGRRIGIAVARSASIPESWVDVKTAYDLLNARYLIRACVLGVTSTFKVFDIEGLHLARSLDEEIHSFVMTLWGEPPLEITALEQ